MKMHRLLFAALAVLMSACSSMREEKPVARIIVVNEQGLPLQGAVIMPETEEHHSAEVRKLTVEEVQARTSDAQGLVYADLELYFWDSDGCYHVRVHRSGFRDETMAVSKDLFPPLLRITMEANAKNPDGAPGRP